MARKVTHVAPQQSAGQFVPFDEIPQDIRELAAEIHRHVTRTGSRSRLEWENEDEMRTDLHALASYCAQRKTVGKEKDEWTMRISPTRNLPATVKDVRITTVVAPANGNGAANQPTTPQTAGSARR